MGGFRIANPGLVNQSLSQTKTDEAIRDIRNQSAKNDPARIDKAARDFESILIGQWLDQAEKSFGSVPGVDPDQQSDSTREQFQSLACQSLAQGLSRNGGFGIAQMISKQLKAAVTVTEGPLPEQNSSVDASSGPGNTQNTK
jgi:Rod binding domain-containing protein